MDRILKLFQRRTDRAQKAASSTTQTHGQSQQQQPLAQHDGPSDTSQGNAQTQNKAAVNRSAVATGSLQIQLQNRSNSNAVYAYITGLALQQNNQLFLLQADAKTPYYPPNPSSPGTPLAANISIPLGAPGSTVTATIPQLAGGRIWFSIGAPLVFAVNPGPGLVEPSIFNPQDPNHDIHFGFVEMTFDRSQVFVNISYVDFVGPAVALTLTDTANNSQHVSGMPANGMQTVAANLTAQTQKDGRRWSSLIVTDANNQLLRILSPNSAILLHPDWFQTYWTDYVNQVYSQYTPRALTVSTQASYGYVRGQVGGKGNLNFGAGGLFAKPTAKDIFGCNTGPFATGQNAEMNVIIPRLAAAFNRSTLLLTDTVPDGERVDQYYAAATTNHYARIVHAANLDGRGYAFPYDD
ncbi:hypothetical protein LTR53_016865, partial [Teratosphaeriaceae sp. CCFEE 6253]